LSKALFKNSFQKLFSKTLFKSSFQKLFSKALVKRACQTRLKKARPYTVIERSQALLLKRYN
jgi:hypothetical protein